ncbi:MAG: hypothetical protein NT040_10540 [Bacteroidetes bacterium]|nr:hypothetical protein [Bacteroidota bacterium]
MQQDIQSIEQTDGQVDTIIIVTTDYWDYQKHRLELFKNMEEKAIPFWLIPMTIPEIYSELRTKHLVTILESSEEKLKNIIIAYSKKIENKIATKQNFTDLSNFNRQLYDSVFKEIDENFWVENKTNQELFTQFLTMRKIKDARIFILPSLPDEYFTEHKLKKNYLEFLIQAWKYTFNNRQEPSHNTRFIFILHEKDLGLGKEYKEHVINPEDFKINPFLLGYQYISQNIFNGLGKNYEIIVFQHDSMNSPNINRDIFVKSSPNENLVEQIEQIILLLKIKWGELYKLRNEICLRLITGAEITDLIDLIKSRTTELEQLKKIAPDSVNLILNCNRQTEIADLKYAFDSVFTKASVSSIL